MSLQTWVRDPDGDLVEIVGYVQDSGWELTELAEEGAVGIGTVAMDDPAMDLDAIIGLNVGAHRQFRMIDDDIAGDDNVIAWGYTADRRIQRRFDKFGNPLTRAWSVNVADANSVLQRRIERGKDCNRPKETDVQRIQWLYSTNELSLITREMISTANPVAMDKADYRGQMAAQVVSDCSQASGKNYWTSMILDSGEYHLTLWYGKDSLATYPCSLSLSNDLADLDLAAMEAGTATVWPIAMDTEYTMDPSRVYSGVYLPYDGGAVYRSLASTISAFASRDTSMPSLNVKTAAKAAARAIRYLNDLSTEDERVTTAVLLPRTLGAKIRHGMRIDVKATHVPGFEDFRPCRIASRSIAPRAVGRKYLIGLTLVPLDVVPGASCSTALSASVTAGVSAQAASVPGTGSIEPAFFSITPVADRDCVIVGVLAANNANVPTDTDMTGDAGWTTEYSSNVSVGSPTAAHIWKAVASPSGSYSVAGTYTAGFTPTSPAGKSSWGGCGVSFATSATSPVQSAGDNGNGSVHVTLAAPPTAGNMLVMTIASRNSATSDVQALYPATGWSHLGDEVGRGTSEMRIGIYARCVQVGDGSEYGGGMNGAGRYNVVCVAEWEVT